MMDRRFLHGEALALRKGGWFDDLGRGRDHEGSWERARSSVG
jgi:hypothetical protein